MNYEFNYTYHQIGPYSILYVHWDIIPMSPTIRHPALETLLRYRKNKVRRLQLKTPELFQIKTLKIF